MVDIGIDESVPKSSDLLIVSAVLGQTALMKKMDSAWSRELRDDGVDFFHAKDHWNAKYAPYHGLSMTKRKALLAALVEHFRRFAQAGITVSIKPEEYKGITSNAFRSDWGAPYAFAIQILMLMIYLDLHHRERTHEEANILIEEGHKNLGQVAEIIPKMKSNDSSFLRLNSYSHGSKKGSPILQAADMLVYSAGKHIVSGDSRIYRQLASRVRPRQFQRLHITPEHISMLKRDLDASSERKRQERLRQWLAGSRVSAPPRSLSTD